MRLPPGKAVVGVTLLVAVSVRPVRAHPRPQSQATFASSCMGDMEVFDIERFIAEVEARQAIWDSRTEVYSDRDKRSQAWNELCLKFIPNFMEKTVQEKNIAATQLQRRWKSFRDCFKREHTKQLKALKKGYSGSSNRKPYKYYQNLSFLINVTDAKGDTGQVQQEEKEPNDLPLIDRPKRKKKKYSLNNELSEPDQEMLQSFSEQFTSSQIELEEADRNFALSLLPHLRQVPYEYKLDAQMEILMVLKKYKPFARHPQSSHFDFYHETGLGLQHSVGYPQPKRSPASSENDPPPSDDSSINENLYY